MLDRIPPDKFSLAIVLVLGAITHAFSQLTVHRNQKREYTWQDFIVYITYGGFAGVMFGLLSQYLFTDPILHLFATGMGAFMGFAGLNYLSVWLLEKLQIKQK